MNEYTDLIREARESAALVGDGDWTPQDSLLLRMAYALEASEAKRVEAGAAALEAAADAMPPVLDTPHGGTVIDYGGQYRRWVRSRAAVLRSAPEGEHTEPKLDPTPWKSPLTGARFGHQNHLTLGHVFSPRPEFSQDPAHYPGGTR